MKQRKRKKYLKKHEELLEQVVAILDEVDPMSIISMARAAGFVIESEYLRLVRAMKIRSFKPGTNMHTYKTYAYLIGMIFVRASARAQRVHQAMMCRGFKGKFYSLYKFSSTRLSWIFSTVMTASLIGLVFLEIV